MEEVDVAIVGAGVSGLAAAVALHRVNPRLHIKVLESRVSPSGKYGGFVKLQPNGLKAAAAISPQLATKLMHIGLHEKRTLLHGEDGRLITRLDTHADFAPRPIEDTDRAPAGPSGVRSRRSLDDEEEEVELAQTNRRNRAKAGKKESWLQRSLEPSALEARRWLNADDASPNVIVGWCELERLLLSMLPQHSVEYQASFLKYHESEGGVIALFEGLAYPLRARVLLGCDGPFSNVRAQCVQDSEPAYDRTVKWVGRLDGHQVSTTPLDYSAWWIKKGQMFVSHPLANGDVAWEALVTDREMQTAGYVFDESVGRVLPDDPNKTRELKEKGTLSELPPSQALSDIFKGWPRSVDQMVRYTPPEAVLEGGVFIRSASDMPPSMGKGRVAILGEAAHPLRPTGQDSNMALEDAAELAAFVQEFGVCKEALRRYDVARRPRWRHVMQLTAAQGASTTTGIALTQGVLNYTQDLYQRDFVPLGREAQRAAARAAQGLKHQRGRLGKLFRLLQNVLFAGVLSAGLLVSSNMLPEAENEISRASRTAREEDGKPQEGAPTEASLVGRNAKRAGRLLRRGANRLAGSIKSAVHNVSKSRAAKLAEEEARVTKEYMESKAEDAATAAMDEATLLAARSAKRSLKHRLAEALGVF